MLQATFKFFFGSKGGLSISIFSDSLLDKEHSSAIALDQFFFFVWARKNKGLFFQEVLRNDCDI